MKRIIIALLRRLSSVVRRSPWLTEQIRRVLAKFPRLRARLLRVNSVQTTAVRVKPMASIRPSDFDPAPPGSLSPAALDAHRFVLSIIGRER